MPTLQQVGESSSRPDFHRLMDGSLDETFSRSPSADSDSLMSIAELLGLNMPRGALVGAGSLQGSSFAHAQPGEQEVSSPPLFAGSPTSRPFSQADDSGYLASLPGSPHPLDMSRRVGEDRRQPRYHFQMPLPATSTTPPQSPYSPGGLPRPLRGGSQTFSDCGSPLEHPFLMNSSSRSNSPESDGSLSSLDNANISDLMSCLYLQARTRSDSGLSVGPPNSYDDHPPPDLASYLNQHPSPGASSSQALKFYQQNQQRQCQSPLGSPLSSPLASTDKSWSPGSLNNSMSNPLSSSLPGSPLYMSSPIRSSGTRAPGTPPSPGIGPVERMSSSLDSNGSLSRFHRGAVVPASQCDATCTWSGTLPKRSFENATFSVKVFLGGVPWDINEAMLCHAFKPYGPGQIRVEWPLSKQQGSPPPKGYVYVIFECEKQVKALLQACSHDFSGGGVNFYFKISSKRMKAKEVQVIPWMTSDTNWVCSPSQKLDPQKTVFVGALHGMLNAFGLASVMNDLFDGVVYAGIDTDKFKYPIGSARVTFNNHRSYMKAVNSRFIVLKTDKFVKKIQVDPYLEDSPCSLCSVQHGPYFCRESSCFRYFCRSCWHWRHSLDSSLASHTWLMRTSKSGSGMNSMTDVGMGLNTGLSCPVRGFRPSRLYNRLPADTLQ